MSRVMGHVSPVMGRKGLMTHDTNSHSQKYRPSLCKIPHYPQLADFPKTKNLKPYMTYPFHPKKGFLV